MPTPLSLRYMSEFLKVPQATKKGYILCPKGGVFDMAYPGSKLRRGRVQGGHDMPHDNGYEHRNLRV